MASKRMRVFAGPNGSGKTTIFKGILAEEKIQLGVYINADDIEAELHKSNSLNFSNYRLTISETQLRNFFKNSTFSPIRRNELDLWLKLSVKNNILTNSTHIDSYLAADLAEFIRQQLLDQEISFTYETVMSHSGKISFLRTAQEKGFRVYLYYIATEDPEINISRVNVRVALAGHAVAAEVIRNRYYKSLSNLRDAVKQSTRAYIFDNSQKQANLIAEITQGTDVVLNKATDLPYWVAKYLMNDAV